MPAEKRLGKGPSQAEAGNEPTDSGLIALTIVAAFHHIPSDVRQINHELGLGQRMASPPDIVRAAKMVGLKSRVLTGQKAARLHTAPFPAIVGLKDGAFAVVGRKQADGTFRVLNPITRQLRIEKEADLLDSWNGTIVLFTRRPPKDARPEPFGLGWFIGKSRSTAKSDNEAFYLFLVSVHSGVWLGP